MKYRNIIFDGSNCIHRISSAVPPLNNANGDRVEVVFGFLKLLSAVTRLNPAERCFICMDGKGSRKLRQAIDPVYKDRRGSQFTEEDKLRIDGMHAQAQVFWNMFGANLPVKWITSNKYEADDIMAMVAQEEESSGNSSLIVSGDGDMLQLVSESIHVFSPNRNNTCTPANFSTWTKGYPDGLAWLQGKVLQGEPPTGDNIPGIKGCGEVNAKKILEAHSWSIVEVLTNPSGDLKKSKLGQAILCDAGRDRLSKNYKLMSLRGHKHVKHSYLETRVGRMNKLELQKNMARMQFRTLLASFNQFIGPFNHFEV